MDTPVSTAAIPVHPVPVELPFPQAVIVNRSRPPSQTYGHLHDSGMSKANRWVCWVMAYATLMRDEYPPFRLDPGGFETKADTIQPGV